MKEKSCYGCGGGRRLHLSLSEERSALADEASAGRGTMPDTSATPFTPAWFDREPLPNPLLGQGEGIRTRKDCPVQGVCR